jgi:hypothetical protein
MHSEGRDSKRFQCAFCKEVLPSYTVGVDAWRAGNHFFCNEFCAECFQDNNGTAQKPSPSVTEVLSESMQRRLIALPASET